MSPVWARSAPRWSRRSRAQRERWPRAAAAPSRWSRSARAASGKNRGVDLKKLKWFADPVALARDPGIDVFVELIGGAGDPAKAAVEAALAAGKSVVTANKALLATHGVALAALAEKNGVALNFEAAVGGAIPIVKTLREGLAGNSRRAHLRHPQRHLQLHPDADGAGAACRSPTA